MAIFRCNKCAHLEEQPDSRVGEAIPCPKCGHSAHVYSVLYFVGKLLTKYFDAQRELVRLKAPAADTGSRSPTAPAAMAPTTLDDIDLANTDQLASELQHQPIHDWFKRKHIRVQFNTDGVDTTGFFDEVAVTLGRNLPVLKDVVERLRFAQRQEHASVIIRLDRKSEPEAREITAFCQQLYAFSFVAKRLHNRQENNIRLYVQTAPAIRRFFEGEWLEWYALIACLKYAKERKQRFSCARNINITMPGGESYELDVLLLIDGRQPIYIECKTGEFREDIDKYLTLRKRLGLDSRNFIMCITGLGDEHAKGLTAMYGLTFANETGLADQLARVF
jgi:hypothetical protein